MSFMAEEEKRRLLARKKRVRAAHHGSVTRIISQVEEAIASTDACRLKQLIQSLSDKSSILSKLDDELIELVEEEELETEVEQADLIGEQISLAVISIEDTLRDLTIPTHGIDPLGTREGSSHEAEASPSGPEEHPATPSTLTSALADPHPTTTSSTVEPLHTPTSSPPLGNPSAPLTAISSLPSILSASAGGSSHITASSRPGAPPLSPMLPLSLPTPSIPPVPSMVPCHTVPSLAPSMTAHLSVLHAIASQVKLPKLSIKKFNGELTKWVTFWDSFNSSIHTNPKLSSVDKFNYLI